MTMRHAGSTAFAARRPSSQTRHLGRQARLMDEDQLRWVEIELAVEPIPPPFQDVGAVLLQCVCGLFLNVQPWPRRQSLKALRPMRIERSASRRSTISFSVMSLRASTMPKTKSAYSSRREPRFRPCGRGDNSPIFDRAIQRFALDTRTPNRAAAERADAPSVDAFKTIDSSIPGHCLSYDFSCRTGENGPPGEGASPLVGGEGRIVDMPTV